MFCPLSIRILSVYFSQDVRGLPFYIDLGLSLSWYAHLVSLRRRKMKHEREGGWREGSKKGGRQGGREAWRMAGGREGGIEGGRRQAGRQAEGGREG